MTEHKSCIKNMSKSTPSKSTPSKSTPSKSTPSKSTPSKMDCVICTNTVSLSKLVKCPFCDFESCQNCVCNFLIGIQDTRPRCMNNDCKKIWSHSFVAENTPQTFHNKTYRERRAVLAVDRERSMFPFTQELVEAQIRQERIREEIERIREENKVWKELIEINRKRIHQLEDDMLEGKETDTVKPRVFTRACPVDDCRGFLSTSLKCGLCSTYACKDCHLPKNGKDDPEHKCDPQTVETIKLLSSDTKNCPACSTPIFKISGCDQMYCTKCHTAFSWKTGAIEKGVIHNPHYYQIQRELNGGVAPRVAGDVECGGLPRLYDINKKLESVKENFDQLYVAHRNHTHITIVEMPKYPNHLGEIDNSDLRIDYLRNKLDDKSFKRKIKNRMKKYEKEIEISQVLVMYTHSLADIFRNIISCDPCKVSEHIKSCHRLREYTNEQFLKIGERFRNIAPCIDEDFSFFTNSKKIPESYECSQY